MAIRREFFTCLIFMLSTVICQCGIIGESPSVTYRLIGNVRSATDTSAIDSLAIKRKITSNSVRIDFSPEDSIVLSLDSKYWISLEAPGQPEEARTKLDNTEIEFMIEHPSFVSIDTTLLGKNLILEKYQRSSFNVTLPDLYMKERDEK